MHEVRIQESEIRMKTIQTLLCYILFRFGIILTTVSCLLNSIAGKGRLIFLICNNPTIHLSNNPWDDTET